MNSFDGRDDRLDGKMRLDDMGDSKIWPRQKTGGCRNENRS